MVLSQEFIGLKAGDRQTKTFMLERSICYDIIIQVRTGDRANRKLYPDAEIVGFTGVFGLSD